MKKSKITAKELKEIGYPQGPVIPVAMDIVSKHYKFEDKQVISALLRKVLLSPTDFLMDDKLLPIAQKLVPSIIEQGVEMSLNKAGVDIVVFGGDLIDQIAMHQMYQAAKLPISIAAALMPDAHSGYGLPIGGVLAVDNAVIPYGVGLDIGCRMCLSIFDLPVKDLRSKTRFFIDTIEQSSLFGSGAAFSSGTQHDIMDDSRFYETRLLKGLQGKAWKQLGSSGSGNHFVEFGEVTLQEEDPVIGLPSGQYLGLLTHSGSRGLGAKIASHYTSIALAKRRLPKEAKNLAWLTLDEAEGVEYWQAMNLAGDYARGCHQVIHDKVARRLGARPIKVIENHHNFAWKECLEGQQVIVHRKGATPAGKDVLGIIPGSMTTPGFIVKGKGTPASIYSAAHGAGRRMSRKSAIEAVRLKDFKADVEQAGVRLLAGGLDESAFAYKDIYKVMKAQHALVDEVGLFYPKIVKMDGASHRSWKDKLWD